MPSICFHSPHLRKHPTDVPQPWVQQWFLYPLAPHYLHHKPMQYNTVKVLLILLCQQHFPEQLSLIQYILTNTRYKHLTQRKNSILSLSLWTRYGDVLSLLCNMEMSLPCFAVAKLFWSSSHRKTLGRARKLGHLHEQGPAFFWNASI